MVRVWAGFLPALHEELLPCVTGRNLCCLREESGLNEKSAVCLDKNETEPEI
jgi:hypothetical protein